MPNYKIIIYFVLALLLQPIIVATFGFINCGPNLILAVSLIMALFFGDKPIVYICAAIVGFLYDLAHSQFVGMTTISILVPMLCCLIVRYIFNIENWLSVLVTAVSGTVIYSLVYWLICQIGGNTGRFLYMLKFVPFHLISQLIILGLLFLLLRKYVVKHKDSYRFK